MGTAYHTEQKSGIILRMWQDGAIAAIQFTLIISFLPTVFHATQKPTLSTSILTSASIIGFSLIYLTLEFWFSALMAGSLGILWAVVAFQRYRLNKKTTV